MAIVLVPLGTCLIILVYIYLLLLAVRWVQNFRTTELHEFFYGFANEK